MDDFVSPYETVTFDVPEVPAWEGKLSPDAHIHYCLLSLQKMLTHENPQIGFLQYCAEVSHIEGIARAAKRIDKDYEDKVKLQRKELVKENSEPHILEFRLAQYRLELLLEACFSNIPLKTMGRV